MDSTRLANIQRYLVQHALTLDLALYNFHFQSSNPQHAIDELKSYQNEDGGFRGSLEHDARLPQSTAIATWTALRIMREVNVKSDDPVLQKTMQYLANTYSAERTGWAIIRPEVDDHAHASWWTYKIAMADFGWGNPSAELLGFVVKYGWPSGTGTVEKMKRKALARISEVNTSDFHEVFTFKGLYELADDALRERLKAPLEKLIRASVNTNPEEWHTYSAPPLRFITSPDDPFAHIFDEDIITKNLAFLAESITGDHWEPNWDWDGAYPEAWQEAKQEWSGQLTVKNLVTLKNFGMIKG